MKMEDRIVNEGVRQRGDDALLDAIEAAKAAEAQRLIRESLPERDVSGLPGWSETREITTARA